MRNIILALFVLWACAWPAEAAMEMRPPMIRDYIKSQKPVGKAVLRKLFTTVYEAAFWSDTGNWNYEKPYALSLTYSINIDAREFLDKTLQEMERVTGLSRADLTVYVPDLRRVFPAVKKGDNITAVYAPKKGTLFYHNGKLTGIIKGQPFSEHFFAIWLSPRTSEPQLRLKLLGKDGA
jgi:hypothetical protein